MLEHPSYGAPRLAMHLQINKKRIIRVMKKYHLKPARRRKRPIKRKDQNQAPTQYTNLIKNLCPIKPNVIWVGDFTYIPFHGKFVYAATIMDLFTRRILGVSVRTDHSQDLVKIALANALLRTGTSPEYMHTDQGSEYKAGEVIKLAEDSGIRISMSAKASPWENGYQESFYAGFKMDLGDPNRFDSLGELVEGIYKTIHYYNYKRIHTSLKTSPEKFTELFIEKSNKQATSTNMTKLSQKMGT